MDEITNQEEVEEVELRPWEKPRPSSETTLHSFEPPKRSRQLSLSEWSDVSTTETIADNDLKVLAIKQPWASLIMKGFKSIEIRTRRTNIRGKIGIYASRTRPRKPDLEWIDSFGYNPSQLDGFPTGKIIGTVELVDCIKYTSAEQFSVDQINHLNKTEWYQDQIYGWVLRNPCSIEHIDFKFSGAIVWSNATVPELIYHSV